MAELPALTRLLEAASLPVFPSVELESHGGSDPPLSNSNNNFYSVFPIILIYLPQEPLEGENYLLFSQLYTEGTRFRVVR